MGAGLRADPARQLRQIVPRADAVGQRSLLHPVALGQHDAGGAGRNTLTLLGGNADVGPEKATTWSFGAEFKPDTVPGLFVGLNYFDIDYKDVIDTPGNGGAVFSDPNLAHLLIVNPTAQQLNDIVVSKITSGLYRTPAEFPLFVDGVPNVYAIADGRKVNTGRIQMKGLDFQASYQFPAAGPTGRWASTAPACSATSSRRSAADRS